MTSRRLALLALMRIDTDGAYANVVLPALLDGSGLKARDRAFATELVYGTTRMRRACDFAVDRFVHAPLEPEVRNILRLGAYQLVFLGTPRHAAVAATVGLAPHRARKLVNAVLRRVAESGPPHWPDDATRLSYPDWIVERLIEDLGRADAIAALEQMNQPAQAVERPDGYVQDRASQWVSELVGARAGERIVDLCAAPGGKATALAAAGAFVVAGDVRPARARRVRANAHRLGRPAVAVVVADGRRAPLVEAASDRVLVDAPCSGLGVLRRRPDARWRVQASDVEALGVLQRQLLSSAARLPRPGGRLVYSACTLTTAETLDIDRWLADEHPELVDGARPGPPWRPAGRGARLLPQAAGSDGMFVLSLRRRVR